MSTLNYGWTELLRAAQLRADPSGVQDAGTYWQLLLLPGSLNGDTNLYIPNLSTNSTKLTGDDHVAKEALSRWSEPSRSDTDY